MDGCSGIVATKFRTGGTQRGSTCAFWRPSEHFHALGRSASEQPICLDTLLTKVVQNTFAS